MSRVKLPFVESMYLNPSIAVYSYMAKLVGEDGIEPSPSDFQSVVHTKYTILPLKLVAVLWVSTPLSPQRAMHQLIMSGNPFYARARTIYLRIKPFGQKKLVEWQFSQWQDLFNPGIMPCTANTLRCLVRVMRHQRGFAQIQSGRFRGTRTPNHLGVNEVR